MATPSDRSRGLASGMLLKRLMFVELFMALRMLETKANGGSASDDVCVRVCDVG